MGGEGTEALLNALLIADVRIDIVKNGAARNRSDAGICRPACPIRVKRPTVFRETVLPPVFGPVMIEQVESISPDADIDRNHFFRDPEAGGVLF